MSANRRQLLWFFIIFGVLSVLLVRGFGSIIDTQSIKDSLGDIVDENTLNFAGSLTAFGVLLNSGSIGTANPAQFYQSMLILIGSLSIIWLYRQQQAGNSVTMKTAIYRGMYPLVPFLLILLVMGLQLIPALIGNFLFQAVVGAGLAASTLESVLWGLLFGLTLLLSLYMLASSSVALYISTLPEMQPLEALREARELVRHRRMAVMFRIFALIVIIFAILFILILPIIFFAPLVAEWLFFGLSVLAIPFVNGYMFSLYRELL